MSPIWRMYPLSAAEQSIGFTLRPLNVTETEDVASNRYLAVDYDESMLAIDERYIKYWSDLPDRPSLRFADSRSEATLFRIKDCGPSFDAAFDLRIGSGVCYFTHLHDYHYEMASWRSSRVKARIVDLKQDAFG